MKKSILIICILFTIKTLHAQYNEKGSAYIGCFLSYVPDNKQKHNNGSYYVQREFYYNMHMSYRFAKRWKTGIELMLCDIYGDNIPSPFYLTGANIDFDILHSEFINLYFRGGLSISNLSFAGDDEPTKRFVINRIIGAAIEFRAFKNLWINVGYYNHLPLNIIKYKYGLANPFVGINYKFNK